MTEIQRIKKIVDWLVFQEKIKSNKELAEKLGYTESSISQILNGKVPLSEKFIKKLLIMDDNINEDWLETGEGEMLRPVTNHIEGHHGGVGQVTGGRVDIHHDEGKDKVIETQEKQVVNMFTALIEELKGFHEVGARRDDRIKEQDTYIASIIKHSYLRNDENMKRLDELIRQQNKLVEMVIQQNERTQNRTDKIVDALIQKNGK